MSFATGFGVGWGLLDSFSTMDVTSLVTRLCLCQIKDIVTFCLAMYSLHA